MEILINKKTKKKVCAKLSKWEVQTLTERITGESCPICMCDFLDETNGEVVQLSECLGHYFHANCITFCFKGSYLICPICNKTYGVRTGTMPDGTMTVQTITGKLEGFPDSKGIIEIKYVIPGGKQGPEDYHPGQTFTGTRRTCYLPDCPEGQEVLKLLTIAWERKLTFRVGDSITNGRTNTVVWNGIHHKTSKSGGPHGYPDPGYLYRVKQELKERGIET